VGGGRVGGGLGWGGYGGYWPYYGSGSGYWPYSGDSYWPDDGSGYYPYDGSSASTYVPYDTSSSAYYSPSRVVENGSDAAATDNSAHLLMVVPADATIQVEGQQTSSTGTQREFVSPALTPGKRYVYTVRVHYTTDGGKEVDDVRQIRVRAGDRWRVDFNQPAPREKVARPRGAATPATGPSIR
jgi:uncharacterized protein (TIGR03000 family)